MTWDLRRQETSFYRAHEFKKKSVRTCLTRASTPLSDCFTLPAVVADTKLFSGQVTVAVIGAATVIPAVRDVAGFAFPVIVALTVHTAQDWVRRAASSVARAVVGTRVYAEGDTVRKTGKLHRERTEWLTIFNFYSYTKTHFCHADTSSRPPPPKCRDAVSYVNTAGTSYSI